MPLRDERPSSFEEMLYSFILALVFNSIKNVPIIYKDILFFKVSLHYNRMAYSVIKTNKKKISNFLVGRNKSLRKHSFLHDIPEFNVTFYTSKKFVT